LPWEINDIGSSWIVLRQLGHFLRELGDFESEHPVTLVILVFLLAVADVSAAKSSSQQGSGGGFQIPRY